MLPPIYPPDAVQPFRDELNVVGLKDLLTPEDVDRAVKAGGTTADGVFTLEDVECIAACTEAPAIQVNYRYRYKVTNADLDRLLDDLRAGRLDGEIPPHGTLARIRQKVAPDQWAGLGIAAQAKVDAR